MNKIPSNFEFKRYSNILLTQINIINNPIFGELIFRKKSFLFAAPSVAHFYSPTSSLGKLEYGSVGNSESLMIIVLEYTIW
ncbi:MAG: hypothetical protein ACFFDN_13025 [Candidatus Hodarchaeota archaeon]